MVTGAKGRPWGKIWIGLAAVAVVLLLVLGVGAFLVLRGNSGPRSVEALRDLLVDAPGKQSTVATHSGAELAGAQPAGGAAPNPGAGARWSVTRTWTTDPGGQGALVLTQFDNPAKATAVLTTLKLGLTDDPKSEQDVPGLSGAFTVTGPSVLADSSLHTVLGYAAKGTVLVAVFTNADPAAYVQQLLTAQLNRLP
jgi:hypothetical protein